MRGSTLLVALLALTTPALAQEGTFRAEGTHSTRGAYSGQVTYSSPTGAWGWTRDVVGVYTFGDGSKLSWQGTAYAFGENVYLYTRYETGGLVGRLEDSAPTKRGYGSYRYSGSGDDAKLVGGWRSSGQADGSFQVTETLTATADDDASTGDDGTSGGDADVQVAVDLAVILPGGQTLPEDQEESVGAVVSTNIDDDDNDGGAGGDGQVDLVADKDDDDGVSGEDDLLKIKLARPQDAPAGSTFRLSFGAKLAVWRNADKTGRVVSGRTLPAEATTLYVEGLAPTEPNRGASLTLSLKKGNKTYGSDKVIIHTTRSAFLLAGHGCTGDYALTRMLRDRALDRRRNPTIVKGQGYWSVYSWDTEKQAKLALSTEGAVISYDGHSNFGMGFAFETNFKKLREFMNIADAQVPVNWIYLREHQEHPQLMFEESEYGDDAETSKRWDPVRVGRTVQGTHGSYGTSRYPARGGNGTRLELTRGTPRFHDSHYGAGENLRIVVKAGSRDMPTKRWAALFLNSCYSAQYYADSFGGRGTLFFTHEEASSTRTSAEFLLMTIDGKSNDEIRTQLNTAENIHDYVVAP